eukprot:CAMPEP_0194132572 /NCGR_PEP_ID=MMETSP0152-20130528/3009_1 /TAXON_ID=1049557 /ORGANISM="Thalassiothrix antarctica, Strain L6-D1" /LENGTH=248 /DNA_ID=CAMNT_0038827667 /DNA_START=74 /DNA_END=820 /DNA_ORIENTATION=-
MTMEQRQRTQAQSIVLNSSSSFTLERSLMPSQNKKRKLSSSSSSITPSQLKVDQDEDLAHALLNLSKYNNSSSNTPSEEPLKKNHQQNLLLNQNKSLAVASNKTVPATKYATISDDEDEDEEDEETIVTPSPIKHCHIMHFVAGVPCSSSSIGNELKLLPLPPPGKPIRAAPQLPRFLPGQLHSQDTIGIIKQAAAEKQLKKLSIEEQNQAISKKIEWKVLEQLRVRNSFLKQPHFPRVVPEERTLCS